MAALSANEIAIIVDRLRPFVLDGSIQKITQPSASRFVIEIFTPGKGPSRILIDLTKGAVRFHRTETKFKNPDQLPAFGSLLRKLLTSGRVRAIEAIPNDRVVSWKIDVMEEAGVVKRELVLELIPAHACLFVLDAQKTIEAASDAVDTEQRSLVRGARYVFPPAPPERTKAAERPFQRFGEEVPEDLFERLDLEIPDGGAAVDRAALLREIDREAQRRMKKIGKIEEDVRSNEGAEDLMRLGEVLKASLHEVQPRATSVVVRDWSIEDEAQAMVTVPLDATLSPQENAEEYFRRAKKKERGLEAARERLAEARTAVEEARALRELVEKASPEELEDAARTAVERLGIKIERPVQTPAKKKEAPGPRKPYHTFFSADGLEIRVGRSSEENDDLTFRHSDPSDWWLHAQNVPGSHVVVRTHDPIPEATLADAATLAIAYSKAPFAGKQPVSYTRRKHVSKFKGAPAGKVMLKEMKTFLLRTEPERLERLKKSRPANER